MARCAASQPLLLAGPLDAGPLRAPAIQRAAGSDGSRQARPAYDAQRLQLECEILVQVGLVVRCDQCTNSGVLVFNELCEPCRVEVEGQARAYINGALS